METHAFGFTLRANTSEGQKDLLSVFLSFNMSGKPIERTPKITLPRGWHAMRNYGIPYRPRDKPVQEDWHSVARKFGVDVKDLIFFNFLTTEPDEVNWYLKHHTGCKKVSPSGNNWMFSNDASPGIIYIPPAEDQEMTFEEHVTCVWRPDDVQNFLQRLTTISKRMPGYNGERIKKLVQVIVRVDYPACLKLWYYNDMNITTYADIKTTGAQLREMTKATRGAFPFDGESGLYAQSGPVERYRGMWQIHPVQELYDDFCGQSWDAAALESSLEEIDSYMYKGWHTLSDVADRPGAFGGGSAYSPLVYEFINHVRLLAKDENHLYHAFEP
jgi:hypothetical protein